MDPLNLGVEGTQWGNRTVPLGTVPDPASQENRSVPPTKGFRFEHPRVPIDWKKVAGEEISAIERRGDVERLAKVSRLCGGGDSKISSLFSHTCTNCRLTDG